MSALAPHPALARKPDSVSSLCQLVVDFAGQVPAGGAIVEAKADGIRALWIDHELVTREGAPILGCDHITAKLSAIEDEAAFPLFFDGELVVDGSWSATIAHFQAGGRRGNGGTLHLFDVLPMWTWRGEGASEALHARKAKLEAMAAPHAGDALSVMPWAYMEDAADIRERAREFIAAGGEGVVVKDALSTYRRGRSANWQRIRKSLSFDVPVVEVRPHRVLAGRLGAVVVDVDGVRVTVDRGFSDAERVELWQEREWLIGAIVEVEAMEKTGRGSLRQPLFRRVRADKRRRYG